MMSCCRSTHLVDPEYAPPLPPRQALLAEVRARGAAVPEVSWAQPGEAAGLAALVGQPGSFLSPARLALYATKRNDPAEPQVRPKGGEGVLRGGGAEVHSWLVLG